MERKQVGMVAMELLERVDRRADQLGQTRRVFVERALEAALGEATGPSTTAAVIVPTSTPDADVLRAASELPKPKPRGVSAAMAKQHALNDAKERRSRGK